MQADIDHQLSIYIQQCVVKSYQDSSLNIFDHLMEKCRLYYDRPAHSIREIKDKMNTKLKGDIFEHFCLKYFQTHPTFKFTNVWLLGDVPDEVLTKMSLRKHDVGIDLIAEDRFNNYYAIQAKYRKRNQYKQHTGLSWKTLSTFYALVSNTGPYNRHIVITNADYVRHIGKKTKKDKSICLTSLQNIKIEQWQQMAGFQGNALQSTISIDTTNKTINDDEKDDEILLKPKIKLQEPIRLKTRPLINDLRERRLQFFNQSKEE